MKRIGYILLLSFIFTGCKTTPAPKNDTGPTIELPSSTAHDADQHDGASAHRDLVNPELLKSYYVGRTVDARDSDVMHEGHAVYRREFPSSWNTNPTLPIGYHLGPITSVVDPAAQVEPLTPELEQKLVQSNVVMSALMQQNDALLTELNTLKVQVNQLTGNVPQLSGEKRSQNTTANKNKPQISQSESHLFDNLNKGETATSTDEFLSVQSLPSVDFSVPQNRVLRQQTSGVSDTTYAPATKNDRIVLVPNASGVIEVVHQVTDQVLNNSNNPFAIRIQKKLEFKEINLSVTGLTLGPNPSTIINDRIFTIGDYIESLQIVSITRDAVFLEKENFLIQIPFRNQPIKLRLPAHTLSPEPS